LTPADTFDNVKGQFPIGFFIWNTNKEETFTHIEADIYNKNENFIGTKSINAYDNVKFINDWVKTFRYAKLVQESIATITGVGSDFQHNNTVCVEEPYKKIAADNHNWQITKKNLIESSIYFAVRKAIEATWLNDRDLFLYPNEIWATDLEFQNDSLTYTIFNSNISSKFGTNHWIPFTEQEVNAKEKFASNFMSNFINGKLKVENKTEHSLFENEVQVGVYDYKARQFSAEATAVFDAGRELWKYYHQHNEVNVNASLYDIREYFQGRNDKGRMNARSTDSNYTELISELRNKLNVLADKIKPKIYEYEFLKE
jgi:hypothetical protein